MKIAEILAHTERDDRELNHRMERLYQNKLDYYGGSLTHLGRIRDVDLVVTAWPPQFREIFFFVAQGEPVGYAILQRGGRQRDEDTFYGIILIWLRPEYRRLGIAVQFYQFLRQHVALRPDSMQTAAGSALWNRLSRNATHGVLTPLGEASTTSLMLYHLTPASNLPRIMRDGLVPQIGARASLIGESTPGIYLFNSVDEAEEAMMNWFGDQFDEDVSIALLAVTVPEGVTEIVGAGYERILTSSVPPNAIKVLNPNL